MKIIRYLAWAFVALTIAAIGYVWLTQQSGQQVLQLASAKIGGPFALERANGTPITDKDLLGKPHAIFFGFTHCPEVCPTTLFEASGWLNKLGEDAEKIDIYFVTVDPERDTPETLSEYMTSFPGITGITGTPEEITRVQKSYRIYSKKVPLEDGDYTMDHTASVFLMDSEGNFKGTIAYSENPDIAFEKIKRLVDNG